MSKDEVFFRNLHIKWQTNKNYHLWKSRCTIQSYFWIVGVFFAKVTRAFLLTKSIFEWKQKWLPLLSFQWYGLTSKIFWWKLHRPFFKWQVPDIVNMVEMSCRFSFLPHFSSGCQPKLLGGPKFFWFWFCGCNHQKLDDFTGFFDLRPVPNNLPWEAEELHCILFFPKIELKNVKS